MVEFALAAGVLLPLMLGTIEFGYAMYAYNKLASAVRGGSRYASRVTYDSASTPSQAYTTAVQNMTVYGDPAGGSTPIVPGLDPTQVAVAMKLNGGVPDVVTVSINRFTLDAGVARITLQGKPAASFRFQGRFAP